jgi:PAP2 superfamily
MRKNISTRITLTLIIAGSFLSGCRKDEDFIAPDDSAASEEHLDPSLRNYPSQSFNSDIAQKWYLLLAKLIQETPGHTPPIAARDIAYTGVTLYESVVAGTQGHQSLGGQLSNLGAMPTRQHGKSYSAAAIANAALARITKNLFANASSANLARIDSMELANEQYYRSLYCSNTLTNSLTFGRSVADAIFSWSTSDGGHQAYNDVFPSSYIPPVGVDKWVPTPPAYQPAMLPYWGSNRTFVPANNSPLIDPPPPVAFSTSPGTDMYIAANMVYTTGNNLTQSQKDIANYWADGGGTFTPPGHNILLTAQVIRNKNMNLRDAAILLAKVGVSLNDAGIACWRTKFTYNLMRPITYIRTYIDASWSPYIGTPPFPAYTSGHATFSNATSTILAKKFGNNTAFTDSTKIASGFTPRSFTSFSSAAEEAAVSRLYGGIHYEMDNLYGFNCGALVANNVALLNW